jgi:hypothetical protein
MNKMEQATCPLHHAHASGSDWAPGTPIEMAAASPGLSARNKTLNLKINVLPGSIFAIRSLNNRKTTSAMSITTPRRQLLNDRQIVA